MPDAALKHKANDRIRNACTIDAMEGMLREGAVYEALLKMEEANKHLSGSILVKMTRRGRERQGGF